jgi:uncharacterized membrane protein YbhN (UPF0104 family)
MKATEKYFFIMIGVLILLWIGLRIAAVYIPEDTPAPWWIWALLSVIAINLVISTILHWGSQVKALREVRKQAYRARKDLEKAVEDLERAVLEIKERNKPSLPPK